MSHTKFAFAALVGLTASGDNGPTWYRLIVALGRLAATVYLAWYVFAPQCVATLGVIRRETGSRGWMWFSFCYMLTLAYLAAFVTFQTARLMGGG